MFPVSITKMVLFVFFFQKECSWGCKEVLLFVFKRLKTMGSKMSPTHKDSS